MQFRLWTVPYPVGHVTSAGYLSTSWVQSFQLFPSEWELCSYWVILISLQSLQRPDWTLDVLCVDRSPAPDPVDSKLFLPSRVKQSDGLGQGTLPGTFDYWHVFWSIASPLLKKYEKNESQSARYPQKPVAYGRGILCYLNCDKWSCVPSHT